MKGYLLTLSVLLALIRANNGKPTVLFQPRYPSIYVGDDVNLKCDGTAEPVKWKFNDKELNHNKLFLVLTMVTLADSGTYTCKGNGQESDAQNLTVLKLEPYAQLSLPPGGAVITRGDARVLTLQVDEDLKDWKCFVFKDNQGLLLEVMQDGTNVGRVYAELGSSQRATFWCKKFKHNLRSNVVTLMMTDRMVMLEPATPVLQKQALVLKCAVWGGGNVKQADFYKNNKIIITKKSDTHIIENPTESDTGQYKCNAVYSYSHISPEAAENTVESDPQHIKVIDAPPAALLKAITVSKLSCSCNDCENCETYQWHRTDNLNTRTRLIETAETIYLNEDGSYTCRANCGNGFSRFSNVHIYKGGEPGGGGTVVVILVVIVIVLLGLICIVVAVIFRRRHRNSMQTAGRNKDDGKKDKSGGDYEQIALGDKAIYHTLGDATDQEKAEGGYEALKKTGEDKAVYHTLGEATDQEKAEGGYEALKKTGEDKAVYHTLGAVEGQSQAQGQGGYEALQSVKAQVYQTLSSGSGKPEGESEGGYEQLPQKIGDDKDVKVEENPYEELKADKQKKEATQAKE